MQPSLEKLGRIKTVERGRTYSFRSCKRDYHIELDLHSRCDVPCIRIRICIHLKMTFHYLERGGGDYQKKL